MTCVWVQMTKYLEKIRSDHVNILETNFQARWPRKVDLKAQTTDIYLRRH